MPVVYLLHALVCWFTYLKKMIFKDGKSNNGDKLKIKISLD